MENTEIINEVLESHENKDFSFEESFAESFEMEISTETDNDSKIIESAEVPVPEESKEEIKQTEVSHNLTQAEEDSLSYALAFLICAGSHFALIWGYEKFTEKIVSHEISEKVKFSEKEKNDISYQLGRVLSHYNTKNESHPLLGLVAVMFSALFVKFLILQQLTKENDNAKFSNGEKDVLTKTKREAPNKQTSTNGRTCSKCGESGHNARTCKAV